MNLNNCDYFISKRCGLRKRCRNCTHYAPSIELRDRKITLRDSNHSDIAEVYVPVNAVMVVSYI